MSGRKFQILDLDQSMNTKDPINQQLKETRVKRELSVPQLAELLELPMDRIYKWEQGKGTPKYADKQKITEWINNPEWKKIPEKSVEENSNDKQSLQSLIASNDKLAQANLTLADAHKIIAQNNEVLIGRLKATGENVSDNPLGHPDVLSRLLEVLAELGEGKLWKTKADGLIQLGNALSVPGFAGENKEGNRVAVGKKSTAGKAQA